MIVVSDTSPLTNLMKIDGLLLMKAVFGRIVIPPMVETELNRIPAHRQVLADTDWIEVVALTDRNIYNQLLSELDPGEAEAMALSIELQADYLLIDEQTGRSVAQRMGIPITGLLGMFILAKQQAIIPAIKPYLQRLIYEAEFHVNPALFQQVLQAVGE